MRFLAPARKKLEPACFANHACNDNDHGDFQVKTYRYETHLHTSETSKCGRSTGPDLARFYKSLGYDGIFVTDHFLNGNTVVPDDLPWAERIALFRRGYDAAAETGAAIGLDVFFGWEYSWGWAHFLTYGLDSGWLLDNPGLLEWDVLEYFERARDAGGSIVHAHPFREKVEIVQLVPGGIDAVEVLNPGRPEEANRHASDFAASFRLPRTAGSDIHSTAQEKLCGVISPRRFAAAGDYPVALRAGHLSLFEETASRLRGAGGA